MPPVASTLKTLFPHGLSGIIYDCDGVMINSRAANTLFYNRVLAYFGLPPMTKEQEQYSFMATGMQALEHILPKELHPQILHVVTNEISYERDIVPLLTLMPGFREFVLAMQAKGLKQAMCTNRTAKGFDDVLSFFSFPRLFEPIITVSVAPAKPSSVGTGMILKAWNLEPDTVLYIGDTSHDKEAAKGAKVPFLAFNSFGCMGDLAADNYSDVEKLLAPLLDCSG